METEGSGQLPHKKVSHHGFLHEKLQVITILGGSPCSWRWLYLKMPSVWSPLRARTSSERRVCTQGSCRSGYRSFCMAMMSCSELPNMDGLKTAFLA